MSLRIVAHVTAQAGKVDEVKALLASLTAPTRQEAGCISYTLYQNNANPAEFTFIEKWENDAALDAHLKTPHIAAALVKIPSLMTGPPDIRRYTKVA